MHTPEPISGTILLIDSDEHLPRQQAVLEDAGFTVITAKTTKDGLAIAKAKQPDLVISEVMLEKPDAGFVLSYQLKRDPATAGVPVVLLSSVFQQTGTVFDLNSPEGRQWIKADLYLERPITPERLVGKVRTIMLHHRDIH